MCGLLAGKYSKLITILMLIIGISFFVIIIFSYKNGISLRDEKGFSNILGISKSDNPESYRADYQLIGYGLAFGVIPLLVFLIKRNKQLWTFFSLFGFIFLSLNVGARGPLVGVLVVYATLIWANNGAARLTFEIAFALVIATLVWFTTDIASSSFFQRFANDAILANGGFTGTSAAESLSRVSIYSFAFNGWFSSVRSFLFGNGFGSFSHDYGLDYPMWIFSPAESSLYPHNFVLEIGYELGLVALLPFLGALWAPFKNLFGGNFDLLDYWNTSLICLYVFVVFTSLVSGSIGSNYILYFSLGTALSASIAQRQTT
jgi:hypothetical protein